MSGGKTLLWPIVSKASCKSIFVLMLIAMLGLAVFGSQSAHAETFEILYTFQGGADGADPTAVILGSDGNLYGTTVYGGDLVNDGTVFKVDSAGNETVLYRFQGGSDGSRPLGGVIRDEEGNLYGTTTAGGGSCNCGTVFKVDPAGNETVLYRFQGGSDGALPVAGLIRDPAGNLYGTTENGGGGFCTYGCGTVFRLDTNGMETVYRFTGLADGEFPESSLLRDGAGNLYGTASSGGQHDFGTVFMLSARGRLTVLHTFTGLQNGEEPFGLTPDQTGNLYGTANGGRHKQGLIYRLQRTGNYKVEYSFKLAPDGSVPVSLLVADSNVGYGATFGGGGFVCGHEGCGTIFAIDRVNGETVLYNFTGKEDGEAPRSLVRDDSGTLYGTSTFLGDCVPPYGCGTVFRLTP